MSSGQQMKKHFWKCCGIKDAHVGRWIHREASLSKSHGSGESSNNPKKDKKDKGSKCGDEEKGDKPHGSDSKSSSQTTSQEQVQGSPCIVANALLDPPQKVVITRVTRSQRNVAKSHISSIRSLISRHRSVQFPVRFLTVLLFLIKYTVNLYW